MMQRGLEYLTNVVWPDNNKKPKNFDEPREGVEVRTGEDAGGVMKKMGVPVENSLYGSFDEVYAKILAMEPKTTITLDTKFIDRNVNEAIQMHITRERDGFSFAFTPTQPPEV